MWMKMVLAKVVMFEEKGKKNADFINFFWQNCARDFFNFFFSF